MIVTDLDWTITYWNRFAETLYGWSSGEALGRNLGELIVPATSETARQDIIMPRLLQGLSWSGEFVVRRRDGSSFPCVVTDSPLRNSAGVLTGVIGVSIDNSVHHLVDDAQARLAAIVTSSEHAIFATTLDGTITDWNGGATAMHGYTAAEMIGQPVSLLTPPECVVDNSLRIARIVGGESFEQFDTIGLHKDGHRIDLSVSITPIRTATGAIVGIARIGRDITEQKRTGAALAHQAQHDALTGLPNRGFLHTRLKAALATRGSDSPSMALLLLDLDRFKEVNDTLGHQVGDRLLKQIGQRLLSAARPGDLVARLGGDEFGVLLPDASVPGHVRAAVERMQRAIESPITLHGAELSLEASIGIALYPDDGEDVETLLRGADSAMYHAKAEKSGWAFHDSSRVRQDTARLTTMGQLRQALDQRELVLHYQPKAVLADGEVHGVEALVRWNHPVRGLVAPDEFIPVAQQTALIKPLTLYVIDEALRQCRAWLDDGLRLAIAVNLSARNLVDSALPTQVGALLQRWNIDARLLELEITESAMLTDPARTKLILERLATMGVRLSIDDFGTGYSSLASLKDMPVSEIKIDRSFVMSMDADEDDATIVRCTIDLARNLGLDVVAEGVETEAAWNRLKELGCTAAQGYYLSRAVPAPELQAWLLQRRRVSEGDRVLGSRDRAWRSAISMPS